MGCGVRPLQGLGIKAVVYEFLVLKISDLLFLQGDDTILPFYPLPRRHFENHLFTARTLVYIHTYIHGLFDKTFFLFKLKGFLF